MVKLFTLRRDWFDTQRRTTGFVLEIVQALLSIAPPACHAAVRSAMTTQTFDNSALFTATSRLAMAVAVTVESVVEPMALACTASR
jgi:hypothetical protein